MLKSFDHRTDADLEIVTRVLAGKTHEFKCLISRFNQKLFRIGMAYLKSEVDTEDAMQSAYLKAFESLSSFRAHSSFSTWLVRIMINECLLQIRNKQKASQEMSFHPTESYEPDGIQKLINTEMQALLEDAILKLPEKYRIVYVCRAINEFSTHDTAGCLNLTTENVKVRFHRAKQLLKETILKEAGEAEAFSFLGNRCAGLTHTTMRLILMG